MIISNITLIIISIIIIFNFNCYNKKIEDDRQNKVQKINEFQEVISSKEQEIKEKKALISEFKQKLEMLKIEKQQFDEERNERIKAKTNLKYVIRNTHENRINNKQLLVNKIYYIINYCVSLLLLYIKRYILIYYLLFLFSFFFFFLNDILFL